MLVSCYFIYFIIGGVFGWIWESIYCTICNKSWENRGFLFGPICPIYGVGAVLGTLAYDLTAFFDIEYSWWMIFLIAFIGSAILEYFTAWILDRLFHAYWWDYSTMPLNYKGRICLPASLAFGVAGLLVVYIIAPFFNNYIATLPAALLETLSLVLMAIMAVDATTTISTLTDFQEKVIAKEERFNDAMNERLSSLYSSTNHFYHATLSRVKGFTMDDVRFAIPKLPKFPTENIQMKFHKVIEKSAKIAHSIEKKGSQLAALPHRITSSSTDQQPLQILKSETQPLDVTAQNKSTTSFSDNTQSDEQAYCQTNLPQNDATNAQS